MKKTLCIILTVMLAFSFSVTAFSSDIFYQGLSAPAITEITKKAADENEKITVSFTSSLKEAEEVRAATADAVASFIGGKDKLINSQYAYLTEKTINVLQVSPDNISFVTVGKAEKEKGSFTLDYRSGILDVLLSEGMDIAPLSEGKSLYVRILTCSENYDAEPKDIFAFTYSEVSEISLSPFGYVEYILPPKAQNPESNIRYFSLPLENDIILASPTMEGYIFDGWSVTDGKRTGKIPAGTAALKLTSHWLPMTYEINYVLTTNLSYPFGKADMTNMPMEYTVGEGTAIYDIKSPIGGFTFGGWYYEKDFSGERVTEISPDETGSRLLYAKWISDEDTEKKKEEERLQFIADSHFGDIDDDGKISASDARLILRAVVGLETLSNEMMKRADYRGTGKIMADNARTTLRLAVGLDDIYKILEENGVLP